MKFRDLWLLFVILGLVLSAVLVRNPPGVLSASLSLLSLSGTLVAFSSWVLGKTSGSRSVLFVGASALLAAAIWFEFVFSGIDSPLRWLLAFALAWMVTPFAALGFTALGNRLTRH